MHGTEPVDKHSTQQICKMRGNLRVTFGDSGQIYLQGLECRQGYKLQALNLKVNYVLECVYILKGFEKQTKQMGTDSCLQGYCILIQKAVWYYNDIIEAMSNKNLILLHYFIFYYSLKYLKKIFISMSVNQTCILNQASHIYFSLL